MKNNVLIHTEKGIYCPVGDFYIDPERKVKNAIITHAHSDHARRGMEKYIATPETAMLLAHRLGTQNTIEKKAYGKKFRIGDALVSLHPAGHIAGSAQVRVEHNGSVWVVSGDYKRQEDATTQSMEVIPCDVFLTESTFGKPQFVWPHPEEEFARLHSWYEANRREGIVSVVIAYTLGKAQRIIAEIGKRSKEKIYVDTHVAKVCTFYKKMGVPFGALETLNKRKPIPSGSFLVISPTSAREVWLKELPNKEIAFASGWMLSKEHRTRSIDRGFAISDHADFPALMQTIKETKAKKVFTLHGYTHELAHTLRKEGIDARPFHQSLLKKVLQSSILSYA